MNTVFSGNLKKFRQQKHFTQEQVAERLGVSTHTVSRWECNTTLPDVTILPELARLYCVTVDDFFKETSAAYKNYARRLAAIYEATREPEEFIRADMEFKKLFQTGDYTTEDLRLYGILHQWMMQYCMNKAVGVFDRVLAKGECVDKDVYWRTKHQKMALYAQIGKAQENIEDVLQTVNGGSAEVEDWICLIVAYRYAGNEEKAYTWFLKAVAQFPDNALLYIYGGDACKNLGRYAEALSYWDRALQLNDTCYDAKYAKLSYYEEVGAYEEAYKLWCEVIADLKRDGYEIEAAAEEKRAQACFEKMKGY